ncbi:hypothetical protein SDC9_69781 [bioreactor metagenome]|uniref:Uncharacterized protein n=1 Tax=bioreactor metagenome TaxID=1076179 RepID=A0A644Y492_9ZZZZ
MTLMNTATVELTSPLAAALQSFNLLPSSTLHPERAQTLWPEDAAHSALLAHPAMENALHRQRSAQLLRSLGGDAAPVLNVQDAAMPLALAQTSRLAQLSRLSGALLLGQHLRRMITRAQVVHARQALQPEIFDWAVQQAGELHEGLNDQQLRPWLGEDLHANALQLGGGLVAQALEEAPAPIRLRAHWKLHPAADDASLRDASGLAPHTARTLCLAMMKQLDSTWLSYFPATR